MYEEDLSNKEEVNVFEDAYGEIEAPKKEEDHHKHDINTEISKLSLEVVALQHALEKEESVIREKDKVISGLNTKLHHAE